MTGRHKLAVLGLVAAVFAAYARVATNEFVNYDVEAYILDNPPVRQGLTLAGVRWAFTAAHSANWHPLTWLSHMLDVELWELDPTGHNLTSVALHALNAVLLLVFLARASGRFAASLAVAALFALHPLRVESVAWVAERKDVLSGCFAFLTLFAYERWVRRPGAGRYALVLLCFALGLLAKPMLVTLPCLLLLLDLWPLRRTFRWRLVLEKLPLFALAGASSAVTFLVQRSAGVTHAELELPLAERAANALVAYVAYLGKTVWPADLACFYPHPSLVGADLTRALYLPAAGAVVLLALVSALVLVRLRRAPELFVGWAWYLGMLVPVIGLVQVGHQAHADRYAYLPLVGIYVAAAFGVERWLAGRGAGARRAAAWATAALVAAFAVVTFVQVGRWRDSFALWEQALRATRNNYMAHHLYGATLARAGRNAEAERHFATALRIRPSHFLAHFSWAEALEAQGQGAGAEGHWREVVRQAPDYAPGHFRLAHHLAGKGDHAGAAAAYERGLALEPGNVDGAMGLGLSLAQLAAAAPDSAELLARAEASFRAVLAARPRDAEAHYALAWIALRRERFDEAEGHLLRALEIRPNYADAHANLGYAYFRLGQREPARRHLEEALRLQPGHAEARATLERL